MTPTFERSLPSSPDTERAVLGSIMLDTGLITEAIHLLKPSDFYTPSHRNVFLAMVAVFEDGSELRPALIHARMLAAGSADTVADLLPFLDNLGVGQPQVSTIKSFARVLRGKALLRALIKEHQRGLDEAFKESDDPDIILDTAERALAVISQDSRVVNDSVRDYKQIGGSVSQMFSKWTGGDVVAIPTQIPEIDRKLIYGGLAHGDFIVLAAQTSFGKTALALQIAMNTARSGIPVLIFSLEMKGERLFIRNLSSVSNVARRDITPYTFRHGQEQTRQKITDAMPQLEVLPIYVADKVRTLSRLSSVATDWKLRTCKNQSGLVVVDYMQLVQNKLSKRSREEEVTGISRELKDLASLLDVPVLGLSQFNRVPSTSNAKPELKDLRESGAIEQDVDLAIFIWSPNKMGEENTRSVNVYCPKQRDGPVGWDEQIDFDAEHQWFRSAQMWRSDPVDWNA